MAKIDFALLRQLQPTIDRPGRASDDGPGRRSATPPDRAAATVEQRQLDVVCPRCPDERRLRLMEHPGGREEARFLVRIGVAEHDLLSIAPGRDVAAIRLVAQDAVEDLARRGKRVG